MRETTKGRKLRSGRPTARPAFVLASSSPRRRELLESAGLRFTIQSPSIDESRRSGELPAAYLRRIARAKLRAVDAPDSAVVLAADTVVVLNGQVLGKPRDPAEARRMLNALSGATHDVFTGVAVGRAGLERYRAVKTRVTFRKIESEEIRWYVATGEPLDKAGAYAIQGAGGAFVTAIRGSHSNVIGLPLAEALEMLHELGLPMAWRR